MTDDRRYMTWEQRAADDARYRPGGVYGPKVAKPDPTVTCYCGKTVIVDGFGTRTGQTCPRNCEENRPERRAR